jgi:hypothetical protein
VPTKLLHLGVDLGIIPICPRDCDPKIIDDQGSRNPAEVAETVLQATDEALRGLPPHHFAIALARMAQDHTEQMWALAFAVHHDPCTLPKIHLHLGSRFHLHSHKRDRLSLPQMPDESFDGLIAADESVITNQILIDALGTQPHPNRRFNLGQVRQAKTLATGCRPGGRNGRF